jgi:hypothetical protein
VTVLGTRRVVKDPVVARLGERSLATLSREHTHTQKRVSEFGSRLVDIERMRGFGHDNLQIIQVLAVKAII